MISLDIIIDLIRKNEFDKARILFEKDRQYLYKQIELLPNGFPQFFFELEEYLKGSPVQEFFGYSDAEYRDYTLGEYVEFLKSYNKNFKL